MKTRILALLLAGAALAALGCSEGAACSPKCDGRACGDDGCGGQCGTCGAALTCSAEGACVPARCPPASGTITVETLCDAINGGFDNWYLWKYRACGGDVTPEDVPHLDGLAPLGISGAISQIGAQSARTACDSGLKQQYETIRASVAAGRLCFDGQAADACAAAGRTLSAEKKYGAAEPDVCFRIFVPVMAEDEECLYSYECTDGLYCRPKDDGIASCNGTCVRPRHAGEPCSRLDLCDDESRCVQGDDGVSRCKGLPGDGEVCELISAQLYCAAGFFCEVDADQNTLCRPVKPQGGVCASNVECAEGLACLPAQAGNTCQPAPGPGAVDAACGGTTQVECDADECLYCDGATADQAGTCKRFPNIGEPCHGVPQDNGTIALECDRYGLLACNADTSRCAARPRVGERCVVNPAPGYPATASSAGDCLYLDNYCKRPSADAPGVCRPLPKVGERCQNRYDSSPTCEPGAFCKGATDTKAGTCSAPLENDASCLGDNECVSGFCKRRASGYGNCADAPGPDEDCQYNAGNALRCSADAWCDTTGESPICVALAKAGKPCTDNGQCASGLCDIEAERCVLVCDQVQRASCWDGLDWFSKYIFATGALGFVAFRRRRERNG